MRSLVPKVLTDAPLAATREEITGPRSSAWEAGKTETSAPLSTRYSLELDKSVRENDLTGKETGDEGVLQAARVLTEVPGVTGARRARFPRPWLPVVEGVS